MFGCRFQHDQLSDLSLPNTWQFMWNIWCGCQHIWCWNMHHWLYYALPANLWKSFYLWLDLLNLTYPARMTLSILLNVTFSGAVEWSSVPRWHSLVPAMLSILYYILFTKYSWWKWVVKLSCSCENGLSDPALDHSLQPWNQPVVWPWVCTSCFNIIGTMNTG